MFNTFFTSELKLKNELFMYEAAAMNIQSLEALNDEYLICVCTLSNWKQYREYCDEFLMKQANVYLQNTMLFLVVVAGCFPA